MYEQFNVIVIVMQYEGCINAGENFGRWWLTALTSVSVWVKTEAAFGVGCETSLTQGYYPWRYNKVLNSFT